MKKTALALATAAGLFLGTGTALAEESGSFRLLASLTHDYTSIEHADVAFTGGTVGGTGTILQTSGAPFGESLDYIAECVIYAKTTEVGVDLEAPCTMADLSGDTLFLVSRRSAGDLEAGGGGGGRWELAGGTGKYAGIGGTCSYFTEYLPNERAISTIDCTWQR